MMISSKDPAIEAALAGLAPHYVSIGHRIILAGDEHALLPTELPGFAMAVTKVRRQSGAARIVARELLRGIGVSDTCLARVIGRAPIWPSGVVGSLAHDDYVAVAAVASTRDYRALGVDVEPARPLPYELVEIVGTQSELRRLPPVVCESRLLFVIKEAVYKALSPIDGIFLDFHDMEVDLEKNLCRSASGWIVSFTYISSPLNVALAFV